MTGCLLVACPVFLCSTSNKIIWILPLIYMQWSCTDSDTDHDLSHNSHHLYYFDYPRHPLLIQYIPTILNYSITFNVLSLSLFVSSTCLFGWRANWKWEQQKGWIWRVERWQRWEKTLKFGIGIDLQKGWHSIGMTENRHQCSANLPEKSPCLLSTDWSEHVYLTADIDKTHKRTWRRIDWLDLIYNYKHICEAVRTEHTDIKHGQLIQNIFGSLYLYR